MFIPVYMAVCPHWSPMILSSLSSPPQSSCASQLVSLPLSSFSCVTRWVSLGFLLGNWDLWKKVITISEEDERKRLWTLLSPTFISENSSRGPIIEPTATHHLVTGWHVWLDDVYVFLGPGFPHLATAIAFCAQMFPIIGQYGETLVKKRERGSPSTWKSK